MGFASDLPQCPSSGVFHNCFGTWTSEDGDKYVGEIKDGKKHGQGTFTFADGSVVEGIWKDGVFKYAQKASTLLLIKLRLLPRPRRFVR